MTSLGFVLTVLLGLADYLNIGTEISLKVVFAPLVIGLGIDVIFAILQIALMGTIVKRGRR